MDVKEEEHELIAKKYRIEIFIGNGKFGSVYQGENMNIKRKVAIKFESKTANIPLLKKETRILEYLVRNGLNDRVPTVFWYGLYREYICVVMSYFGNVSFSTMTFSQESLLEWFTSAISLLETIHFYRVIHRDLKPGHFLFYEGKWKLIDFGFAIFVSDDIANHEKKIEYIIGTPNYISINVHDGIEPGKKDDMISLGYLFLEKYLGELPWKNLSPSFESELSCSHIQHPLNLERKAMKESNVFFDKISHIPGLLTYMKKYY